MTDRSVNLDAATTFIQSHTTVLSLDHIPFQAECPVCLETYTRTDGGEIAVKIVDVPGCDHLFGLACLTSILTRNDNADKKCPLCRTVWVPRRRPAAQMFSNEVNGVVITAARRSSDGGRRRRTPQIINLASDSEDEVTPESYMQFSRDIADIRTRARNTQLSRRQRRDAERAANIRARAANINLPSPEIRPAIEPVPRRRGPVPGFGTHDDEGNREHLHEPSPDANPERSWPLRSQRTNRVDQALSRNELEDRLITDAERVQHLNQRDFDQCVRERLLDGRLRALEERERNLFVREQRVAQREARIERLAHVRRRQLDEVEQMAERHLEELRATQSLRIST